MIKGYKAFNKGLINRYGTKFVVGETYSVTGDISFGNDGNGFHLCVNLEDTLRYFDGMNDEIDICVVLGFGGNVLLEDTYNEYFDMFSFQNITIAKCLTRKEIMDIALDLHEIRVIRFIQGFKLTKEEIDIFKNKFHNNIDVLNAIAYYQEKDLDVYYNHLKRTRTP